MYEHATSNRTKRGFVKIKRALEVLPHGDSGVESRLSKEIKGWLSLGKEEVPKVWGKGLIYTRQDGQKVGLERSDCLLSTVLAMHIWRDQLKLGLPGKGDGVLVGRTGLVVQDRFGDPLRDLGLPNAS